MIKFYSSRFVYLGTTKLISELWISLQEIASKTCYQCDVRQCPMLTILDNERNEYTCLVDLRLLDASKECGVVVKQYPVVKF